MALDLFVVLIYAAAMLVLGYYGMRKAKTNEDYLVAGRNLGPTPVHGHHGRHRSGRRVHRRHRAPGLCPWHLRFLAVRRTGLRDRRAEPVPRQTAAETEDLHRYPGAGKTLQPDGPLSERGDHAGLRADDRRDLDPGHRHRAASAVRPAVLDLGAARRWRGGGLLGHRRHVVADPDRHRPVRDQDRRPDVHPAADLPVPRRRLG